MKALISLISFVILSHPLFAEEAQFPIHHFRNHLGQVFLDLYDITAKEPFPTKPQDAVCHQSGVIEQERVTLTCDLQIGRQYAAAAYHDENKNGRLDHDSLASRSHRLFLWRKTQIWAT